MAFEAKHIIGMGIAGCLLAGTGCSGGDSGVKRLGYYAGGSPGRARPLPPRPTPRYTPRYSAPKPKPAARRNVVLRVEKGWTPPGGFADRWDSIVIHHSASDTSTPQGMEDWHVNGRGWDALGYHFVIGNGVKYGDGRVYVGERWTKQMHGAHCKTPGNHYNNHGIGICLIGDFRSSRPTAAQMASLSKLTQFLMGQCGVSKGRILTHGGVTGKTECPGPNFNLAQLVRNLNGVQLTTNHRH